MSRLPGAGDRVVIWGYGRHGGGRAAARFCAARGARVTILEAKPAQDFAEAGLETRLHGWAWHVGNGSHPALQEADLVVPSPAIPPRAWPASHPSIVSPEALFLLAHRGPRVAVTGTKGKSTTARILGCLLGWRVAGNSYEPLLDLLERHGPEVPLVCELSSFQAHYLAPVLDGAAGPAFAGAVFTSLAVDHLDWHPDLAHYHQAKLRVATWAGALAVAPELNPRLDGRDLLPLIPYVEGVFADGLARRTDLDLLGEHNARNAVLAITLARHLGTPDADIAPRLRQVKPLPHRLEPVALGGGVGYINDSIATTPESCMAALAAVAGPLAVILGGSDKGASYQALARAVVQRGAFPVLFGSTAPRLAKDFADLGVEAPTAATFPEAVALARAALARATPAGGGSVLLSPACASFDRFRGFEDRGDQFRALARAASSNGGVANPGK